MSRSHCHPRALLLACMLTEGTIAARAVELSMEGVGAWQSKNTVESPNDGTATRFDLDAITGNGPYLAPRLELTWAPSSRQELRFLVAPLSVSESGTLMAPVAFEGADFAAGPIDARYRFDSYRVTWRYRWLDRPDLVVRVGFTAKLRDATIQLSQGGTTARKDDTGFVPLLNAALDYRLGNTLWLLADIDALGGGPGYAVDAGLRIAVDLDPRWRVQGGVRFLDGGADTDEVYAFARFTSVVLGLTARF